MTWAHDVTGTYLAKVRSRGFDSLRVHQLIERYEYVRQVRARYAVRSEFAAHVKFWGEFWDGWAQRWQALEHGREHI